jgi:hypothetical protein
MSIDLPAPRGYTPRHRRTTPVQRAAESALIGGHLLVAFLADVAARLRFARLMGASWPQTLTTLPGWLAYCAERTYRPLAFAGPRPTAAIRSTATGPLRALGHTPDAVAATLARHWQTADVDPADRIVEDYLYDRLGPWHTIEVGARLTVVDGVWALTPPAVRGYLHRPNPAPTPAVAAADMRVTVG